MPRCEAMRRCGVGAVHCTLRSTESRGCSAGPRTALLPQRRTSYTFYLPLDLRKPCAIPPFPMPHAPCPLPSPFPPFHLPPFLLVAACPMSHVPCPMSHVPCPCRVLAASTLHLVPSLVFSVQAFRPYHAVSGLSAPLQSNQYNLGVRRPGGDGLIIHAQVVHALQACGMQ